MRIAGRGGMVWLGMILAGFALGAYVFAAWPGSSPRAGTGPTVRSTASVSFPESELAGVAAARYPEFSRGWLFEPGTTPALDAVISASQQLDAG